MAHNMVEDKGTQGPDSGPTTPAPKPSSASPQLDGAREGATGSADVTRDLMGTFGSGTRSPPPSTPSPAPSPSVPDPSVMFSPLGGAGKHTGGSNRDAVKGMLSLGVPTGVKLAGVPADGEKLGQVMAALLYMARECDDCDYWASEVAPYLTLIADLFTGKARDVGVRIISDAKAATRNALGSHLILAIYDGLKAQYATAPARVQWRAECDDFTFARGESPVQAVERYARWWWMADGCMRSGVKRHCNERSTEDLVFGFRKAAARTHQRLAEVKDDDPTIGLAELATAMDVRWANMQATDGARKAPTRVAALELEAPTVRAVQVPRPTKPWAEGRAPTRPNRERREWGPFKGHCFKCEGKGHMADVCPYKDLTDDEARLQRNRAEAKDLEGRLVNKEPQYLRRGGGEGAQGKEVQAVPEVAAVGATGRERFWVEMVAGAPKKGREGGVVVRGLADTGSTDTLIPSKLLRAGGVLYKDLGATRVKTAVAFGGSEIAIVGEVEIPLVLGSKRILAHAFAFDGPGELILGMDILTKLGVARAVREALEGFGAKTEESMGLPQVAAATAAAATDVYESLANIRANAVLGTMDDDQHDELLNLLCKHRKAFLAEGALPPKCNWGPVELLTDGNPEAVMRTRPWSEETKEAMRVHESKMLQYGVIELVQGRAPRFNVRAEPMLVPKPSGDTRHVIDYSHVNPFIRGDPYPVPSLEEQISKLATGEVGHAWRASKYDCSSGFFAIELESDSRDLTTFRGVGGLYRMTRLAMGMKPSVPVFQRMIDENLINRLPEAMRSKMGVYVDDVGHSSSAPNLRDAVALEIKRIEETLKAAEAGVITFRLSKCRFVVPELDYLGAALKEGMRAPKPSAVKAILDYGPLKTKKDVQRFMGICEGMRPYVKNFGILTLPIRECAKQMSRGPLSLSAEARVARERLEIQILKAAPLLIPVQGKQFTMRVDASEIGLGVVLEQEGKMVRCWSRVLTPAERNYSARDREKLAMTEGLESMELHVGGRHVSIQLLTDHKPLAGAEQSQRGQRRGARATNALRARYDERLSRFNFTTTWVPREEQVGPDALAKSPAFRLQVEAEEGKGQAERGMAVAALEVVQALPTDSATLRALQVRDSLVRELIEFKEDGVLPLVASKERQAGLAKQAESFEMVEGVLYRKWEEKPLEKGAEGILHLQLALPEVDDVRGDALRRAHGDERSKEAEGAHESAPKMMVRLRRTVWWPTMLNDAVRHAGRCHTCKEQEAIRNNYGLLQPTTGEDVATGEAVAFDLAGPYPATPEGHTYLMLIIRMGSGYPELVPLTEASAVVAAEGFYSGYVVRWGVPPSLRSDRANNLNSAVSEAIYKDLGIDKKTTASYNPQADGMAENLVRRTMSLVKKLLSQDGDVKSDWTTKLPRVALSLRSQHSNPRGMSPFKAEHRREMMLPAAFNNPQAILSKFMEKENLIHKKIVAERDKAAEEYSRKYNKGRVEAPFKAGDRVWWAEHDITKLDPKRTGPYKVVRVLGNGLDVELEELPQGPRIGRRHKIVNVKEVDLYTQEPPVVKEDVVKEIVKHRLKSWSTKKGKRTRVEYLVRWSNGEETWEPARHMMDEVDGEETTTAALLAYWKANPAVRATAGR